MRERGNNVIDIDYDRAAIIDAVKQIEFPSKIPSSSIYGSGDAGKKIADLLAEVRLKFHKTITFW